MSAIGDQQPLFGERANTTVSIDTDGRTIRPLLGLVSELVDESRVSFDEDGLHIAAHDQSNVALVELEVAPDAFDAYDLDGGAFETALNYEKLMSSLRLARRSKSNTDRVLLSVDEMRSLVTVNREYGETGVELTDEVENLDPESVREATEPPEGVNLPWQVEMDVDAFVGAIDSLDSASADAVKVFQPDGRLTFAAPGTDAIGDYRAAATIDVEPEALRDDADESDSSLLSVDYLATFADALDTTAFESLEFRWGQEFPVVIEIDEPNIWARYFLAPRVTTGGDE